ncbi:MAG: TraR/DksA C4-type zinc finger protein [Chloroflexi bacterium]|nr:TraR/DksA C4-type zinc finger protein [Chloroflexota bacterium]
MAAPRFDEAAVRQALQAELARIGARFEALARLAGTAEGGSRPGFGKRVGDYTAEVMENQRATATARSLGQTESEIRRALAKLDEGTYGLCDTCRAPIDAERLAAIPTATHCVPCKSKANARRRR